MYYSIKAFIPRIIQLLTRRIIARYRWKKYKNIWPIDKNGVKKPENWSHWPNHKRVALVLTHDIESADGQKKCISVANIEKDLNFRSSFNFVPERYNDDPQLRKYLTDNGFEVGVHGLNHDGRLYRNKKIFEYRAERINKYIKGWSAVGFRSPAMHHNLEWIHLLDIQYDLSTFDTDPFEPQPIGMGTIFPLTIHSKTNNSSYIELPYTLPQDSTLFLILNEKNVNIWKEKFLWIIENGGMVLLNTHPDYMNINGKLKSGEYTVDYYIEFLEFIKNNYIDECWHALPKEVARFWKKIYGKPK